MLPAMSLMSPTVALSVSSLFAGILTAYNSKESTSDFLYDSFFADQFAPEIKQEYDDKEQVFSEYSADRVNIMKQDYEHKAEAIPAPVPVDRGLIESSTINSGLINTLATASNKSDEIAKELNNSLSLMNKTLLSLVEAKGNELAKQDILRSDISDSLKSIVLSLSSLSSIPKIIADSQSSFLTLEYSIHGALDYQAKKVQESVVVLSSIKDILLARTNNAIDTNAVIVDGVSSQIETNTKTQESLDYQKEKNVTASDGTQYTPREILAKANAEHHLDKKGHNTMDWSTGFVDMLDILEIEETEETSLKNLLELLKTTPFEVINSHDDGKALFKREVV